jgi:dCTP deaminase
MRGGTFLAVLEFLKGDKGDKGDPGEKGDSGQSSGFWSAERIKEYQEKNSDKPLFWLPGAGPKFLPQAYDFDHKKRLKGASYNLLMGCQVYVTPVNETDDKSVRDLTTGQTFRIPAGQFAFLLTHEAVSIPCNAIGLLALRARELKFQGLINVSGFHIDPGYSGRLVVAVYNAGPREIHISQGDALFEVFIGDLDRETNYSYDKSSDKDPIFRIEPRLISGIAGEFETLQALKSKMEETEAALDDRIRVLEREQTVVRWASALILGALIALGVRGCSPPASAAVISTGAEAHA